MHIEYRRGAIGALTDEYERALKELKLLLVKFPNDDFIKIYNKESDTDFQSVRNIVLHLVRSGYGYANYIRKRFGDNYIVPEINITNTEQAISHFNQMFTYTVETFEDKWLLTDDEMMNTIIKTSWTTYDLEAIIEHAIVHILRHRRQIEKMIIQNKIT